MPWVRIQPVTHSLLIYVWHHRHAGRASMEESSLEEWIHFAGFIFQKISAAKAVRRPINGMVAAPARKL